MKAFPLLLLKIPPHSYQEDLRNDANSDVAGLTGAFERGRTLRETHNLKQIWLRAGPPSHHGTCSQCLGTKVELVIRFKTTQHPEASFFQSCVKGWARWVSQMEEQTPNPNQ